MSSQGIKQGKFLLLIIGLLLIVFLSNPSVSRAQEMDGDNEKDALIGSEIFLENTVSNENETLFGVTLGEVQDSIQLGESAENKGDLDSKTNEISVTSESSVEEPDKTNNTVEQTLISLNEEELAVQEEDDQDHVDVGLKGVVHVQNEGWLKDEGIFEVEQVLELGTTGKSQRLEALKLDISDASGSIQDGISYQVHVQNIGWMDEVSNYEIAGTEGRSLRIEAIKLSLSDELSALYDIFYRAHVQNYGWLDWTANGLSAGSEGLSYRLEAIQIVLSKKNSGTYTVSDNAFKRVIMKVSAHVQDIGWISQNIIEKSTVTIGTTGQSKRLEAFSVEALSIDGYDGGFVYQSHVQNIGWQDKKTNGEQSGTTGKGLSIESVIASLYGQLAEVYDLYVRAHVSNIGWLDWACATSETEATVGTSGYARNLECLQLCLVVKGGEAPGASDKGAAYVDKSQPLATIEGAVLIEGSDEWQNFAEGKAGSTGESKSLTALKLWLGDQGILSGSVSYQTHQADIGWTDLVSDGEQSGTGLLVNALQAVRISLSGTVSNLYDVWYRVHEANIGWMGWTRNGGSAGTASLCLDTESIQIVVLLKGGSAPGSTNQPYTETLRKAFADNCEYIDQNPELPWGCESVALTVVLRAMGYDIGKTYIADNYLSYSSWDYVNCYAGNPYNATGIGTAMPPAIVSAANSFLSDHNSPYRAYELTGASFSSLYGYIDAGYPLIVWTTMYMSWPYNTGSLYGYDLYSNQHCVTMCNYDRSSDAVLICDSLSGKIWRNASDFESIYNACGNMAIVIC